MIGNLIVAYALAKGALRVIFLPPPPPPSALTMVDLYLTEMTIRWSRDQPSETVGRVFPGQATT